MKCFSQPPQPERAAQDTDHDPGPKPGDLLAHCSTDEGPEQAWVNAAREALALPTDDTALRQALKAAKEEMRERCAVLCESYQWNAGTCAAGIRALEVK